jgi:hypothetical protein
MTRANSASSTALLTNLDAALCEDDSTTHPLDAEDLALLPEVLEDDLPGLDLPDE